MNKIKDLYIKYKEVINYLFFGGCTFLVSIISFFLFNKVCNFNEHVANVISWILAVSFAYITNKKYVFESKTSEKKDLLKEIGSFVSARILTLVMEELILLLGVNILGFDSMLVKVVAQVVVIVANYFLSKLFIFKK